MSPQAGKGATRAAQKFAVRRLIRSLCSSAVGLWAPRGYRKKSRALFLLIMSNPAMPATACIEVRYSAGTGTAQKQNISIIHIHSRHTQTGSRVR
jgi:hypothetical protein